MLDEITVSMGLLELNRYSLQMHSILLRLLGYAKHKARTVASSGLVRVAWLRTYLRAGGASVQLPCANRDLTKLALDLGGRLQISKPPTCLGLAWVSAMKKPRSRSERVRIACP